MVRVTIVFAGDVGRPWRHFSQGVTGPVSTGVGTEEAPFRKHVRGSRIVPVGGPDGLDDR